MKIEQLAILVKEGFDEVNQRLEGIETDTTETRADIRAIKRDLHDLSERVGSMAGYAKEIDELMSRITAIEKQLGMRPKTIA